MYNVNVHSNLIWILLKALKKISSAKNTNSLCQNDHLYFYPLFSYKCLKFPARFQYYLFKLTNFLWWKPPGVNEA